MAQEFDLGYIRGPMGPKGPKGPAGPMGPIGPMPHITIGKTTTLPAEDSACVVIRDGSSPQAPILDFGIPRGKGDGDMTASVYDPNNLHQDIFAYADAHSGKKTCTITVAAADSANKSSADLVCSGRGDQITINQAVNSLPKGGGIVFLQEGTYHLDTYGTEDDNTDCPIISITADNITLQGCGSSTVLKLADNSLNPESSCHLLYAVGKNLHLRDICIDGNASANTGGTVNGVYLTDTAITSRIENCLFKSCSGCGIRSQAADLTLKDNIITACGIGCFNIADVAHIHGNILKDITTYGIQCMGGNAQIMGNHLRDCGKTGIYLQFSTGDIICGNSLQSIPVGIHLQGAAHSMVSNNTIRRDLSGSSYADGEYPILLAQCSYVLAICNQIPGKAVNLVNDNHSMLSFSGNDWNNSL